MKLKLEIYGLPQPGGSKTAFLHRRTGKLHVKDSNPLAASWKGLVIEQAALTLDLTAGPKIARDKPIAIHCRFYLPRPKGHFGSGKNADKLKATSPRYPTTKPDATKLWRSTEDALTGIIWHDDSQIVLQRIDKVYADTRPVGATIIVSVP